MNLSILTGNLTKDPELRRSKSRGTSQCTFTLAVERGYNDADGNPIVDFIPIIAWRQTADLCARYLTKGRKVAVRGSLQYRTFTGKDGAEHAVAEVAADKVEFLDKPAQQPEAEEQA